ncbi:MAG: hypothetical protein ABW019_02190 [Chitinophagaceae bacterium]
MIVLPLRIPRRRVLPAVFIILVWLGAIQPARAQVSPGNFLPLQTANPRINSYRIIDTILLQDTIIIIDTTIKWRSSSPDMPPNTLGKAMMTPVAWGTSRGGVVFVGIGASFPQVFTSKSDMIAVAGLSIGNPNKIVGGSVMLNVNDVSQFNTFSCNIILNKHLSNAGAISAGGIHLFRSGLSDAGASWYIVYSHAIQSVFSRLPGASALHYSIGVGSGRFRDKSPADKALGRSQGTAVFANLSYELLKWMNVNAEWSGTNLHAGVSIRPARRLPAISMGIADITNSSGDRRRFVVSMGYSFYLPR